MLGGLPVYHPLENIVGSDYIDDDDFACSTEQLVMGGGSGERPGAVLQNPESAVANFILHSNDFRLTEEHRETLEGKTWIMPMWKFHGWSTKHHYDLYKMCTEGSLPNNYYPETNSEFEIWLHQGFGEFIYYSFPQLALPIVELFKPLHVNAHHMRFNNILAVPPGMPVYANGGNAFFK